MAIADITSKIQNDAQKEAEAITEEARVQAKQIEATTAPLKEELRQKAEEELKETLALNERRIESAARQAARKHMSIAKRKATDEVFLEVLKKTSEQNDEDYSKTISALIKHLPKKAAGKDAQGKMIVPEGKEKLMRSLLRENNIYCPIETSKDISGGFIFENPEGEYDLSFEKILADKKPELEVEVGKILFEK